MTLVSLCFCNRVGSEGAVEMSISQGLMEKAKGIEGVIQWPYKVCKKEKVGNGRK
jgi:hypothetical protein